MVVALLNSTGDSFWIPAYSLNDRVYESGVLFTIFAFFQIALYIFTGYVIVRTCWIFLKIKVFHENMNILMAWFLLQWIEAIIAKMIIIPYQIGLIVIGIDSERTYYDWWTSNPKEMVIIKEDIGSTIIPLYISSYFLWHYMYSILFSILAIGFERVCATYYIQDYEHVRRRHIPIILIILTNCVTIPYAYQTSNNRVSLLLTCFQCFLSAIIVFFGYLVLWRVNLIWRNRIMSLKYTHLEKYSLARKFQIEENIRSLLIARKLVISAVIFITFVCSLLICLVFELAHGYDTFFVYALDNSILLPALVMSMTLLCCSPAWKEKFLLGIPGIRRFRNPRVSHLAEIPKNKPSAVKETEVYFEQLRNAWT